MFCYDEYYIAISETLRFGLFTSEVPALVYYSHITAIVFTLLLSLFVIFQSRTLPAKILFAIAITFSTLSLLDIFLWITPSSGIVMFLWSFWLTLFILIFGLSFYFLYTFITKKDLHFIYKLLFILVVTVIEFFSVTTFNLEYFDYSYCEAVEGVSMLNIVFGLSFFILISSIIFGIYATGRQTEGHERHKSLLATIGVGAFLFIFSSATYLTSILSLFFVDDQFAFQTEQYGYYGMTIFMLFLGYIIVQYKAFNIKLIGANALVSVLVLLTASQFLFVRTTTSQVLTAVTLILIGCAGYFMIRSVKHEVRQRQQLEELTTKLEKANKRLKSLDQMKSEFVSIASHQLRSPLTSIRGYASMLLEGSYGKLTPKAIDAIERISDSSHFMAESVEDYLNVSRIQAGNMKYEMMDFNIKTETSHIVDDIRQQALKKGLILTLKTDLDKQGIVYADIGKTKQILHNLINNSLKYTPKGRITVFVHDVPKKKKVYVDIIDTGIGMSQETLDEVFAKFERAHNANEVNVTGTGLGLFIARKIARDMGGDVTAHSDGEGKGSIFSLELPLKM